MTLEKRIELSRALTTANTERHWVLEVWEKRNGQDPYFVGFRLHKGTIRSLINYWNRWNRVASVKRFEQIVGSGATKREALMEFHKYMKRKEI